MLHIVTGQRETEINQELISWWEKQKRTLQGRGQEGGMPVRGDLGRL